MLVWGGLFFLLIALALMASQEVTALGSARRAGGDVAPAFRRFRRRIKGLALLLALYILAAFYRDISQLAHYGWRQALLHTGLALVVLIWLLILAARDARESALVALEEGRRLRLEAEAAADRLVSAALKSRNSDSNK